MVKREGDWLREHLENIKFKTSQDLADSIVQEAIRLADGCLEDDGVVLVLQSKNLPDK